jgi:hypothetical protein
MGWWSIGLTEGVKRQAGRVCPSVPDDRARGILLAFSGEAVIQESLGRSPRNLDPRAQALKARFNGREENTRIVRVFSRAFSAKTHFIIVPRASPQAFLNHGFAALTGGFGPGPGRAKLHCILPLLLWSGICDCAFATEKKGAWQQAPFSQIWPNDYTSKYMKNSYGCGRKRRASYSFIFISIQLSRKSWVKTSPLSRKS